MSEITKVQIEHNNVNKRRQKEMKHTKTRVNKEKKNKEKKQIQIHWIIEKLKSRPSFLYPCLYGKQNFFVYFENEKRNGDFPYFFFYSQNNKEEDEEIFIS